MGERQDRKGRIACRWLIDGWTGNLQRLLGRGGRTREGEMRALDLLAVVSHFSFFSFVVYCAHPGLKRREADGRRRSLRETAVNLTKTHRPFRSYPSFPAQLTLAAHSLPLSANKQHKVYIFSPLLTFYSRPVAHTLDGIRIRRVPPSCTFPNAIFFCW